jgi:hypothetical protein
MPKSTPIYSADEEQQLMTELWSSEIADDPLAFVMFVFPFGKPGTPLEHIKGPRKWQRKLLKQIADYIKNAKSELLLRKHLVNMFRAAIASGRGNGKSALLAWLAIWLATTRIGASVWVTANGEPQLKTKTFPEISKWMSMAIHAHWFDINATSIVPAAWLSDLVQRDLKIDPKYWYIAAQLWSEENPDAFAGAHNVYGEMYLFDEASGIPSPIWTVAQGVFTEAIIDRYWFAFSNPRRNDGAFYECFFGEDRDQWLTEQINCLDVEGVSKDAYMAIIKKHGVDSDEARVEVYGQFPNQANNQFIATSLAADAAARSVIPDPGAPLLLGVDVARSGKAKTVLAFRKGRDAASIPWEEYKIADTVKIAELVATAAQKYRVDAIFVDGGGVGGGVVDVLKSWGYRVIEVQFGSGATESEKHKNKRSEMWAYMREWLSTGQIPNHPSLLKDLTGPEYGYDPVTNQLLLESKEHMAEKRRLASPDMADALAMTFAQTVARNDTRTGRLNSRRPTTARDVDFNLFG